jgi:flagella basal body P-ring formation protein FlgA
MKHIRTLAALALGTLALGARAAVPDDDPDRLTLPPPPASVGQLQPTASQEQIQPTASAGQPQTTTDVALFQPAAAQNRAPEVIFTDDATASERDMPEVPELEVNPILKQGGNVAPAPAPTASAAAAAPVEQVLAAISKEAPKNDTLESMLFTQLHAAMPQGSEGYIFENVILPTLNNLPAKGWKVRYDFRMPTRGIGQATFTGRILDGNERQLRSFTGSVAIDREASGAQATRVIHRGEALRPGDIQLMGTRLSQLPRGALDRIDALPGTIARSELRPGQWLTEQMVQVPQVIRQNQPVTMVVNHGPIHITAPGISQQNGALGEVIRVANAQSQRTLFARVLSKDEVQVVF